MAIPVLLGYLSQFFCEKRALEELSILKNDNDSEILASEGTAINRNAYLYATGLMLVMLCIAVQYTWVYYWSDKIGMMSRIIMTGAIYRKVIISIMQCYTYTGTSFVSIKLSRKFIIHPCKDKLSKL